MDNHISKASHINQTRKKIGGKDSLFGQHAEHIRIILRIPKSLPGDQATADIQTRLNRHLKAALDGTFQADIPGVFLERADLIPFAF